MHVKYIYIEREIEGAIEILKRDMGRKRWRERELLCV